MTTTTPKKSHGDAGLPGWASITGVLLLLLGLPFAVWLDPRSHLRARYGKAEGGRGLSINLSGRLCYQQ